jgi:MFS family permease
MAELSTIAGGRTAAPERERTPLAAWFTLAILLVFFFQSFIDKQMMSLVANAMGKALQLRDTQLGLIVGAAFGIFYTISVLGAGYLIDRYSKRVILLIAVFGWSIAAMATGLARDFSSLFLARALVGIGEGFLPPASFAIIAAVFPRHRVGTATGIFFGASGAGAVAAFVFGGKLIAIFNQMGGISLPLVGHLEAWRSALVVMAAPGMPFALLALLIRDGSDKRRTMAERRSDGFWAFLRKRRRLLLLHNLAFGMNSAACYAVLFWAPAYLERDFAWKADRIGFTLAIGSSFSILGNILWGSVADRIKRCGYADSFYRLYPALYAICIPVTVITFVLLDGQNFLMGYVIVALFLLGSGGLTGALQLSTPAPLRGRVTAFQTLASGVFGLALSPTLVPLIAELCFHDRQAVGYSIAIVVAVAGTLAATLLLFGRKSLSDAITSLEAEEDGKHEIPAH